MSLALWIRLITAAARLTHHVHILDMNGDSYRLATSQKRARKRGALAPSEPNIHEAESAKWGATNED
ncbi:hypothetical protein [Rhodoferax fermentans]|uniref:hypothetical protein n=1 Tax=Rhodoferax fermentans TaxID=28066 RepID=UPI00117BD915|nr:hypothetical protein [Rhodoferax fermentans]MBK1685010.1 hypothetical protein [Rhodoferax fermentans]